MKKVILSVIVASVLLACNNSGVKTEVGTDSTTVVDTTKVDTTLVSDTTKVDTTKK